MTHYRITWISLDGTPHQSQPFDRLENAIKNMLAIAAAMEGGHEFHIERGEIVILKMSLGEKGLEA